MSKAKLYVVDTDRIKEKQIIFDRADLPGVEPQCVTGGDTHHSAHSELHTHFLNETSLSGGLCCEQFGCYRSFSDRSPVGIKTKFSTKSFPPCHMMWCLKCHWDKSTVTKTHQYRNKNRVFALRYLQAPTTKRTRNFWLLYLCRSHLKTRTWCTEWVGGRKLIQGNSDLAFWNRKPRICS